MRDIPSPLKRNVGTPRIEDLLCLIDPRRIRVKAEELGQQQPFPIDTSRTNPRLRAGQPFARQRTRRDSALKPAAGQSLADERNYRCSHEVLLSADVSGHGGASVCCGDLYETEADDASSGAGVPGTPFSARIIAGESASVESSFRSAANSVDLPGSSERNLLTSLSRHLSPQRCFVPAHDSRGEFQGAMRNSPDSS
jgi:hypothetical protein